MRHPPINAELFVRNRGRLASLLPPNSLAVVNSNDVLPTNADGTLNLVPNADLFYLTGVVQEQSIVLIYPDADDPKQKEILFLREPIHELELWEGRKLSREMARKTTGIQNIQWLADFPRLFHRLLCECGPVFLNSNEHKRAVVEVETREARFVAETIRRYPLHDYQRLAPLLHRLRSVKSAEEVELLQEACGITEAGFRRCLKFVRPGRNEMEVEAELSHEFIRRGGGFAYSPIIASGSNACSLHYNSNSGECRKGDLLLLDVGARYANYQADMTRTIPVSGRFSPRQKKVYQAVLRVLRESTNGLVPGKRWKEWQKEAENLVEKECVDLGLLKPAGIRRQNPDQPAVKKYFMHGVGHPLGLDVHDVGLTTEPFAAGWVMTVEPAIYLPEEGFGIRLENDVLLTENGPKNLMEKIPIEPGEIESLMKKR